MGLLGRIFGGGGLFRRQGCGPRGMQGLGGGKMGGGCPTCCGRDRNAMNGGGNRSAMGFPAEFAQPAQNTQAADPFAGQATQAPFQARAQAPDFGPAPVQGNETGPPIDGRMIQPGEVTGARNAAEASAFGRRLFDLVNLERARLGVAPVTWDPNLSRIAMQSAVARDHTTHPEVLVPWGYESPEEAMWAFKQSPGHWATIIDPNNTKAGGAWNDDAGAVAFGDLRFAGWEGR